MRSRTLCIAALSFFTAVIALTAAETSKNLIHNGDLEAALPEGSTLPKDWSLFQKPEGAYKAAVVDGGHAGKKSVIIEGDGEFAVLSVFRMEIDPKKRLTVRGHLKVEGDAKATIKFDYFNEKFEWIASTTVGDLTSDTKDWQALSVMDRASVDAGKAKHVSAALSLIGKGKAWFDDLQLTAAPAGPAENTIENGDFENFLGTRPAQWWLGSAEGGKVAAAISTTDPKQGKHCMHFKGDAEWAVATSAKVKFDPKKTHTVTGFIRTKSGAAQIKIDYFNGDEWLGSTFGEDVHDDEWTEKSLEATNEFPDATHIAATCVGTGEFDAKFDAITLMVK